MRSERAAQKAAAPLAALSAETPASINCAAELTSPHLGALVVYVGAGADVARVLLQCRETNQSHTAPVATRLLKGRPYRCAIFIGLGPGGYTVRAVTSREAIVTAYRERNRVERLFNRLKQHRAIATRSEQLAEHDAALLLIAAILLRLYPEPTPQPEGAWPCVTEAAGSS